MNFFVNLIPVADRYDNKSVTIISYAYGPGYFYNRDDNGDRINLDTVTIGNEQFVFFPLFKPIACCSRHQIFFFFLKIQTKTFSTSLLLVLITRRMVETMLAFSLEDLSVTYLPELLNRITFHTFVPTLLVSHRKARQTDAKKIQDDDDGIHSNYTKHSIQFPCYLIILIVDCCLIKYIVAWRFFLEQLTLY